MKVRIRIYAATLASVLLAACGEQPAVQGNGRYNVYSSENGTILLDSATGKSWLQVYATDRRDKAAYWEPTARQDDAAEWRAYDALHPVESSNSS